MVMESKLCVALCVVALVGCARAYSSGAPDGACKDMIPQHHTPPQKSAAPYAITTSAKTVKAGEPLEVVITGKSSQDTVKGFLLQARQGQNIVGKFTVQPNDAFAQTLDCGGPSNAVTHKKHDDKLDKRSAAFTWTAPVGFNDEIKFRATVALDGGTFWVGVESAPIKVTP